MSRLLLRPISYRHAVFPDRPDGRDRAVNFTPVSAATAATAQPAEESLSADDYDSIQWLFHRAGLNADDYRRETIKRRIPACLRGLRLSSMAEARNAVQRQPELLSAVIGALVIGVTGFFRDRQVFDTLETRVVPDLLARVAAPRVWSAGCSNGSELYSLAMLLAESGGLQRSSLLGTDCRIDALERAREGRYEPAAMKDVPAPFLDRYFQFDGAGWRTHPYLRTSTEWRCGNLPTMREPGAWDLVLCRNTAMYLHAAVAARLWHALCNCLRPGGYLVVGKAERPHGAAGLRAIAPCVYRCDRS